VPVLPTQAIHSPDKSAEGVEPAQTYMLNGRHTQRQTCSLKDPCREDMRPLRGGALRGAGGDPDGRGCAVRPVPAGQTRGGGPALCGRGQLPHGRLRPRQVLPRLLPGGESGGQDGVRCGQGQELPGGKPLCCGSDECIPCRTSSCMPLVLLCKGAHFLALGDRILLGQHSKY